MVPPPASPADPKSVLPPKEKHISSRHPKSVRYFYRDNRRQGSAAASSANRKSKQRKRSGSRRTTAHPFDETGVCFCFVFLSPFTLPFLFPFSISQSVFGCQSYFPFKKSFSRRLSPIRPSPYNSRQGKSVRPTGADAFDEPIQIFSMRMAHSGQMV